MWDQDMLDKEELETDQLLSIISEHPNYVSTTEVEEFQDTHKASSYLWNPPSTLDEGYFSHTKTW